MKQLTLGLLLSLPFLMHTTQAAKEKYINLGEHNEQIRNVLALADGHFINNKTLELIFKACLNIQDIQLGDRNPNDRKTRTGRYQYRKQRCSVVELADLEENFVGDPELNEVLARVKLDFENSVAKFIEQASGVKQMLVQLIKESCERRNRKNSLLLTWAEAPEGHETIIFNSDIQSFKEFNLFCQDLLNYLGDLVESCPKARKQFQEQNAKAQKN